MVAAQGPQHPPALQAYHDIGPASLLLTSWFPSHFTALTSYCLLLQAVVSDVPTCGGVAYAKEQGIATLTYPTSKKGLFVGPSKEELVQQLTEQRQVDFVLLAGYLKARVLRMQ